MCVLHGKVTGRLIKCRQRDVEISIAPRVHVVVSVQSAADSLRTVRPDIEQTLLNFVRLARVIHVPEVDQEVEPAPIGCDRGGNYRGAVQSGPKIADETNS